MKTKSIIGNRVLAIAAAGLLATGCGPGNTGGQASGGPYYVQGAAGGYGAACQVDANCTAPNYCIKGQCRPLSQQGGVCGWDGDCLSPLKCIVGACGNPGNIGAPCGSWEHCVAPLACWNGMCSQCTVSGTSATTGSACCDDLNCQAPLFCILGTCRPIGGDGCHCGVDNDCESKVCEGGTCVAGGTCWETGTQAQLGGACRLNTDCMPPYVCLNGMCSQAGQIGSPCYSFSQCSYGLACWGYTCNQCTIAAGASSVVGSTCCTDDNCSGGLYCILGSCRWMAAIGETCGVHWDCESWNCAQGVCQPM